MIVLATQAGAGAAGFDQQARKHIGFENGVLRGSELQGGTLWTALQLSIIRWCSTS
jgi:hypothetical protein